MSKAAFLAKYGTDAHKDMLVNHRDEDVRRNVALRGNASHLDKLVHDKDEYVREAVSANPAVSDDHLKVLANDKHAFVRHQAQYRQMKRQEKQ